MDFSAPTCLDVKPPRFVGHWAVGAGALVVVLGMALAIVLCARGAAAAEPAAGAASEIEAPRSVLTSDQWKQLDSSVDRALEFLAKRQRADGSFETTELGQPGVTALCVLAFLSRGHVPHEGKYGRQLDRAIEYVLDSQQDEGILFAQPLGSSWQLQSATHTGAYNHAIAGLMLGEVYGMTQSTQRDRVRDAIRKALVYTRQQQQRAKRKRVDDGGWRYVRPGAGLHNDADLSITSWYLMFLRSARNAEFDVPKEYIDEALGYVRNAFDPGQGAFKYGHSGGGQQITRATVGGGILSLSLAGDHQSEMARTAGQWVLKNSFERYNQCRYHEERYHYSAYYCSQAMFQLGGEFWARFYPPFMRVLLQHQHADGSWDAEASLDRHFGNSYTTALMVLALTPPYQLLPIYQR